LPERFVADVNVPIAAIVSLRRLGHDVVRMAEIAPLSPDSTILEMARSDERLVLTFDKDFGDLIFRDGLRTFGVVLCRLDTRDVATAVEILIQTIGSREDWAGHFSVIRNDGVRVTQLPPRS
jgi:predicted nuclease of predicted toxin-antitoxin system